MRHDQNDVAGRPIAVRRPRLQYKLFTVLLRAQLDYRRKRERRVIQCNLSDISPPRRADREPIRLTIGVPRIAPNLGQKIWINMNIQRL